MKKGFSTIMAAQFFSALADAALGVVALELLRAENMAARVAWLAPMLALFYVLLAPFLGAFADAPPKRKVMLAANGLKMIGCLLMLASVNPLLAHAVVGLGAAAYSPAKYGIVIELLPATMGMVYRWHRSNRVRQRDEVDQLLAVAHSGPHGSGRHRRIKRAAERRYARRMKAALNGACRSAINPIRRTPRRSCDSCAEYLTAVKRARRSRRLKCAPHAADFRPPCRSISTPVWRQP